MLEPSPAAALPPGRFRALAVRHGLDLEPELPDPAPAYVDPDGALHPALTEPVAAMLLHSWPTPAARAALVARALSEPGRFDPTDPEDPFVRLSRFAQARAMEPEVQGALALLLLRGLLGRQQVRHRPSLPDPEAMLDSPDLDAFRGRRARLRDADGAGVLIDRVLAAARTVSGDPALAFERLVVQAAGRWLPAYVAWGRVVDALGPEERIPTDATGRATLQGALEETAGALSTLAGGPSGGDAVAILGDLLRQGAAAEEHFLGICDERPDGPVQARWMLAQQIRSMRDLSRFTRPRALDLHDALRECDALRLGAHLAWRCVAITLWARDAAGRATEDLERALCALPDPPHPTTLYAGLGRLRGFVLLRRLRRGDEQGALELAEAALHLAPEELAVRITANDLRFGRGDRSLALLDSLRAEGARYRSLSVALMGTRVATALGDRGRARAFRDEMVAKATPPVDAARWLVLAGELLRSPGTSVEALAAHLGARPPGPAAAGPLLALLEAASHPERALDDAEAALWEAFHLASERDASRRQLAERGGKIPGWRRIAARAPISAADPDLCGALYDRLADLRAASHALRQPPVSSPLRRLCVALSRAADHHRGPPSPATAEALVSVQGPLADLCGGQEEPTEVAARLEAACRALEAEERAPRIAALAADLRALRGRAGTSGHSAIAAQLAALSADLDAAPGAADPDAALDALDESLVALDATARAADGPGDAPGGMRFHPDFDRFSREELGMRPDALRRARQLVALFNEADGRRDRKRLRGTDEALFELRHRTQHFGGLRVYYRPSASGWEALAAMSKYDDRPQRAAIARILASFEPPRG